MGRRGSGEGTIGQWRGGWRAALRLKGDRRVWLYGKTRREVADKLVVAVRAVADGRLVGSPRQTVGVFLERWLESTRPTVRQSTWIRYAQLVRVHMLPSLSKIQLGSLSSQHLEELYAERIAAGAAPRTVHHVHAVLRRALNVATRWGLIVRNPTADIDPPRVPGREMRTLSEEQF
nr:site-specific integrase [Actinomycetota bacterium]